MIVTLPPREKLRRVLLEAAVFGGMLALWAVLFALDANAQMPAPGWIFVDSSEAINTTLQTPIGSNVIPPFAIKVKAGDGVKFTHSGRFFIITLDATGGGNLSSSKEEMFAVWRNGDSLTVLQRQLSNTTRHVWNVENYLGIRVSYLTIKQIQDTLLLRLAMQDSINARNDSVSHLLPSQSGQSGKVLATNGSTMLWTNAAGAVFSITAVAPLTGGAITSVGSIGIPVATASVNGYLSSADWAAFNAKQDLLPSLVSGAVLTNNGSALSWTSIGAGTVTSVNGSGGSTGLTMSGGPVTTFGTLTLGGTLAVTNGGTGSSTAAGALNNLLPTQTGHAGQFLKTDGAGTESWDTVTGSGGGGSGVTSVGVSGGSTGLTTSGGPVTSTGTITLAGTLGVANGGTALTTTPANGKLLIGNGTNYTLANETAGTGISITNGAGSITIANTGVTSVGLSVPAIFTVASTPVTTTGTIAIGLANEIVNVVFAGPDTGTGLPTFRGLVPNDIPNLDASKITTGVLGVPNGGTGVSTFAADGVLFGGGSSAIGVTAVGTAGQVLTSNGAGLAPTFQAVAGSGTVISVDISGGTTGLTSTGGPVTSAGTLTLGGTLVVANGGTGAATISGILFGNGTSAVTGGHAVSLTSEVTGTLPVANGGTGRATLTNHSLLVGATTTAITQLGSATNGQLPIGSTGADPVLTAITAGTGISVTNGAGTITIGTTGLLTNPMTTTGDVIYSLDNSGTPARLGIGTAGQFLTGGTTPAWGNTLSQNGIAATPTIGLLLSNTTASTAGVTVQEAPLIELDGGGWSTTATAHDSSLKARIRNVPVSAARAYDYLGIDFGNAALGWTSNLKLFNNTAGSGQLVVGNGAFSGSSNLDAIIIGTPGSAIQGADRAGLFTGKANIIQSGARNSVILGGGSRPADGVGGNLIGTNAADCAIIGGAANTIGTSSANSAIIAGGYIGTGGTTTAGSYVNSYQSVIVGGQKDTTDNTVGGDGLPAFGEVALGGIGLYPQAAAQVVLGAWNKGLRGNTVVSPQGVAADARLVIGNGTSASNRTNAFVVYGNGKIEDNVDSIATTYTPGLIIQNQVTSTVGVTVQMPGSLEFSGHARGNGADSLFQGRESFKLTSATVPTGTWEWASGSTALGFTNNMTLTSAGLLSASSISISGTSTLSGAVNFGGDLSLSGAINLHVVGVISGTHTVAPTECVVPCDATGSGFTVTLTASAVVGQVVVISKTDAGANTVTVAPNSGQSIIAGTGILSGGNVPLTLAAPTGTFVYVGTSLWVLLARI